MAKTRYTLCILLTCLLGACGSTPRSNYYMLSADATGTAGYSSVTIGIKPIEIPAYLDRSEMVTHQGDNRLAIADYERWAEPLDKGIERVLVINLSTLLNARMHVFPWQRSSQPQYVIRVRVMQLSIHNNLAELVAQWSVINTATKEPIMQKISQLSVAADNKRPIVIADTYSQLLLQLSTDIAAVISNP